ncbi:MAG: sigma-70 family RNA polymerase sigma factor [Armatimonadetes bacterium]|nr:sigma-70 family RNA polymerase sigma factor [Armatimonadota bacterium]
MLFRRQNADRDQARAEFEKLALRYQREIYNAALRIVRNRDDAEDLAQEALVKAYVAFGQFQPGTNFKAWIFRILMNTYINEYRRRMRAPDMLTLDDVSPDIEYRATRQQARSDSQPEEAALSRTFEGEIEEALRALPEEFKVVVLLTDVEEFSYAEVSDILDIPIGTVRSRLFRGRKLLRSYLSEFGKQRGLI